MIQVGEVIISDLFDMEKVCKKCGEIKQLELFTKDIKCKDGYTNRCKVCAYKFISSWVKNNKDKVKISAKKSYLKNIDKKKLYGKEYKDKNKEKNREYRRQYVANRKKNDSLYKLTADIRKLIQGSIKTKGFKKHTKTQDILGCSFVELKQHLESKFEDWMTWDNHGNWNGIPSEINIAWDIDHIEPLVNAKTEEDIIRLNHYTNLQPLCSYTNRWIKGR